MKTLKNWGLWVVLLKIGGKLLPFFLKLLKSAKVVKGTLVVTSAVTYAYLFTWQMSAILITLLFVHEYGHIWAMKKRGMKVKGMYFIPFLGAAAVPEDTFPNREAESYTAIMGPIWGLALSILVLGIYEITQDPLYAAAASFMALINIFNLLPINPLDGGRVIKSISYSINNKLGLIILIIGILLSIVLIFVAKMYLFLFVLIIGSLELLLEYKNRNKKEENMNTEEIIRHFITYIVTAVLLYLIIVIAQSVPETKLALDILKDKI